MDQELTLTAAEYVLGTLELPERLAFEARLKSDPALRDLVAAWEADFAALNDEFAEVAAPNVLPAIEARLFATAAKQPFWRQFLFGAVSAAALAAAVVVVLPRLATPLPQFTAELRADAQPLTFSAHYDGHALVLNHTGGPGADATHDYELWVILADGVPKSMGVIEAAQITREMTGLPEGATLAVTYEVKGGSPTGQPQGPLLISGVISAT